jgi:pimeloyl-ACP methyl ester carboxylesterase
MDLLPGIRSVTTDTTRLRVHHVESGPADGEPVVLVHGNLSSCRIYEHLMPRFPDRYRVIAPDMRGFGESEHVALDATRGLADWADDLAALLDALDVNETPHLLGWSTGGAAIARYALQGRAVASLTLMDPVGPFGLVGTRRDGTPWFPDYAGSGAGIAAPEVTDRLAARDLSTDSPLSPRNLGATFWGQTPALDADRVDLLVDEMLKTWVGEENFPGDSTTSDNWPGFAPGRRGIGNALSPKYCSWDEITDLDPKPPILWIQGGQDTVVSDTSIWDPGFLGAAGMIPGWPGDDVCPAQPMVTQIRDVLAAYEKAGGEVRTEWFDNAPHLPLATEPDRWLEVVTSFLADHARRQPRPVPAAAASGSTPLSAS